MAVFEDDPRKLKVAGGSARGSMDHLVAALAVKQSGGNPRELRYIPYNAGAQAMVGLLSGETQLLSTGLSEAIALADQGEIRILAMTGRTRAAFAPDIPALQEYGVDVAFENWRGFFGAPGLPQTRQQQYQNLLEAMYETPEWERIRSARGWDNLFISGDDFRLFLSQQEQTLGQLLIELGMKH